MNKVIRFIVGISMAMVVAGCSSQQKMTTSPTTTGPTQYVKVPSDSSTPAPADLKNEGQYVHDVGTWFAQDFFTLQGKSGPSDVGGLKLPAAVNQDGRSPSAVGMAMVDPKLTKNFEEQAIKLVYAPAFAGMSDSQLPKVASVTIQNLQRTNNTKSNVLYELDAIVTYGGANRLDINNIHLGLGRNPDRYGYPFVVTEIDFPDKSHWWIKPS